MVHIPLDTLREQGWTLANQVVDQPFFLLSACLGATPSSDTLPFDFEGALIQAAGYLTVRDNTETFWRSSSQLTAAQLVAYFTPQHTAHTLR